MDLEFCLIGSAVLSGNSAALQALKNMGLSPADLVSEDAARLYTILIDHAERYRKPPHPDTIKDAAGIDLSSVREPFQFYFDIYNSRRLKADLVALQSQLSENLETGSPQDAISLLEKGLRQARQKATTLTRAQPIFALSDDVIDMYERAKRGERGIITRWPSFNEMTTGLCPGDFVLIVARTSVGKTWISLVMAIDAWKMEENRKKVLYVTTEMTQVRMARRFSSIHMRLPFGDLRKGKLGEFAERRFRDGLETYRAEQGFDIIGGDFDFSMDALHAAIDQVEPDILFLDGAYLMKDEGNTRTERAANVMDSLKRLSHQTNLPFVLTTQLNRGAATAGQAIGTHNVALTDVAGWHSDLAFALTRTAKLKDQKRIQIEPIKIREGEEVSVQVEWDFDKMSFEEVDPAQDNNAGPAPNGDAKEDVGSEF